MPAVLHEGCTWEQNEQSVTVGGRLCSMKRVGCCLVPIGGYDWILFE
jgi:hypothetical protein